MYIFGGSTRGYEPLTDVAALHITSMSWLVFPTMHPLLFLSSVCRTSVFRKQIFLFTDRDMSVIRGKGKVYVLDTAQIRWLPDPRNVDMVPEAFESGYVSMRRTERKDEPKESDDKPKTVSIYKLEPTALLEFISAFASKLCQSLGGLLSGQRDILEKVTQILPGLLTDYSIKLSLGQEKGPQKDAAQIVHQYRRFVASTTSMSNMHISLFLPHLLLKSIKSDYF
jgi:hypothetical protein